MIDLIELTEKYQPILGQDVSGFVDTERCDSTLMSGMIGTNPLIKVDMEAAKASPGRWYRRPINYPECYSCSESRSTISRDMLLGVYWWAHTHKNKEILEEIWSYAWKNLWRMGDGRWYGADTIMNPIMMSTLARMLGKWWFSWIPAKWSVKTDSSEYYVNKLTALHIILRKELGKYTDHDKKIAQELLVSSDFQNPLFALAAGEDYLAWHNLEKFLPDSEEKPLGIHSEKEYIYEWMFVAGRLI